MTKTSFADKSTCSVGKTYVTKWATCQSKFNAGPGKKSLILLGSYHGFPRHMDDELNKGFLPENVIVAEQDPATFHGLVHYQDCHDQYRDVTLRHGDIMDVFNSYPTGAITHADIDAADGYRNSIDIVYQIMQKEVETIFWTIALRSTSMKALCPESEGGWEWRHNNGKTQWMPPKQKVVIEKLLKESPNGKLYDIELKQYTGVGSGNNRPGGSQMLMFTLNRKIIK